MFNLAGKVALVTGATGGIGEAVARALHTQGATVILHGRNEEKLKKLQKDLGERAEVEAWDLGNLSGIEDFAKRVLEKIGGKLDILVNNAGLTKDGLMMRMSDEQWQQVIDVNLTAIFKLSRELMMPMMKQRSGRIINMSSVVGAMGNAGQVNYSASKGGLIAMTKSMAMEVGSRGITVNAIAPGFITSAMTDALPDSVKEEYMKQIPTKKFGQVSDVAAACVYLASDEANYMTGQTLHVNGGMLRV
ncbi:MAG: 3-oxoacyl-[acyl-carrier-protein] reductase [Alphaproteobacteria bacterium]|nr:3-oxoacyl-[acyl-carrier-protein] reductase [Alphaproteobacteria bacterium]